MSRVVRLPLVRFFFQMRTMPSARSTSVTFILISSLRLAPVWTATHTIRWIHGWSAPSRMTGWASSTSGR
jgi:hypothetical protein